jgi:hypothetical protein
MYQFRLRGIPELFQLFQNRKKKEPGSGLTTSGYQFYGRPVKNQTAFQKKNGNALIGGKTI